ncbi:MAG: hypothetical protein SOX40_08850 [Bacteroidaceae bacterium]|nr:hypothetical protein [Bacteroidaceae bacterium]
MAEKPEAIDRELNVSRLNCVVTRGEQKDRLYPENIENGNMFHEDTADYNVMRTDGVSKVKYDMPGKIVANTQLTRRKVATILTKIRPITSTSIPFHC